jgi:hypothetical protein
MNGGVATASANAWASGSNTVGTVDVTDMVLSFVNAVGPALVSGEAEQVNALVVNA